jgi:hypothetical protein
MSSMQDAESLPEIAAAGPKLSLATYAGPLEAWGIPALFVLVLLIQKAIALQIVGHHATDLNGFLNPFCRWDCEWYISLAQNGYDLGIDSTGKANWAFFPLLPATSSLLSRLSGLTLVQVGTLLSLLATYIAACAARPLCGTRRQFVLLSALLLCGPASVYFTMPYTEALFVLFTILVWVNARAGKYVWAGLAGAMLSADRAVGLIAAAVILAFALERHIRSGRRLSELPRCWWQAPAPLLGAAIAPLGLGAFSLYLRWHMGDGLAFIHIQREWGRIATNPLRAWWDALISGPILHLPSEPQWMAIATIVAGILVIRLLLKRDFAMALFCVACVLVPLGTGVISMLRFVAALAPLWVEVSELVARRRYWFLWLVPILAAGIWCEVLWLNDVHVLV